MNYAKKNTTGKAKREKARKYLQKREQEAQYITELAREQQRLEEALRFKFLVQNKNLSPRELAGVIMEVVNVNGINVPVTATVTEADAEALFANKVAMLFA